MSKKRRPQRRRFPSVTLPGKGDVCHRCGLPTSIRAHSQITPKHLEQPFYYERWFLCENTECQTTLIMPDRFRVWRDPERAQLEKQRAERKARRKLIEDQLGESFASNK